MARGSRIQLKRKQPTYEWRIHPANEETLFSLLDTLENCIEGSDEYLTTVDQLKSIPGCPNLENPNIQLIVRTQALPVN